MADKRSYAALEWVIGEIGETLDLARKELDAFVEDPEDTSRIGFCFGYIHQVHGSLKMLNFSGASTLALEMELLAQAMVDGAETDRSGAQEVLMRSILQLPSYLSRVKLKRSDNPLVLLPLLNELRAMRRAEPLTGADYFNPNIDASADEQPKHNPARANPQQYQAIAAKLRKMYQHAASGVIRGVKTEENLDYLGKVFERVEKITQGTSREALWKLALALCDVLRIEHAAIGPEIKTMLRELDKELRLLAENPNTAFTEEVSEKLLKSILYYIAHSSAEGERSEAVRRQYELDAALEREGITDPTELFSGPDLETIRRVVSALNDELEVVKHALDSAQSGQNENAVTEALPTLYRVAGTLSLLDAHELRSKVLEQASTLETALEEGQPSPEVLADIASDIVSMERRLAAMANGVPIARLNGADCMNLVELNEAQDSVFFEAINGLEQIKDAILECIETKWDRSHLGNISRLLSDIRGGLGIIPLSRLAEIFNTSDRYINEQFLQSDSPPSTQQLELFADVIAGIEYYLERLVTDREEDDELLLGAAERSLEALGYPVMKGPEPVVEVKRHTVSADTEPATPEISLIEDPEKSTQDAEEQPLPAVDEEPKADVESSPAAAADTSVVTFAAEEDDEVDDEIIEIFIEEAMEVLGAIDESLPQWAENFENESALSEIRRAFHTLKGSGRMVGAFDIGEFAWSIEDLFNRVLDKTVKPHKAQATLVESVRGLLPDFIKAFEQKQSNPHPERSAQYIAWAETMARGEIPAELVDEPELRQAEEDIPLDLDDDDIVLWEIFCSEAVVHLKAIEDFLDEMTESAPVYSPPSESLQRSLHTLKGSAHMAEIHDVAALATPLELFAKDLRTYQVNVDEDILQLLRDGVSYTHEALDLIRASQIARIPKLAQYHARVAELRDRCVGPLIRQEENKQAQGQQVDPRLLSIMMAEEMDQLLDADDILIRWQQGEAIPQDELQSLIEELDKLATGADQARLPPMAHLSSSLSSAYQSISEHCLQINAEAYSRLLLAHSQLLDMVDAIAAGENLSPADEATISGLNRLKIDVETTSVEVLESSEDKAAQSIEEDEAVLPGDTLQTAMGADYDKDIIDVFIEEADELCEEMEHAIHDWEDDKAQTKYSAELKRCLHTLKGGARLSALMGLGELAHGFESFLVDLDDKGELNRQDFAGIHKRQDELLHAMVNIKCAQAGEEADLSGLIAIETEPSPDLDVPFDITPFTGERAYGADILPFKSKQSDVALLETPSEIPESASAVAGNGSAPSPLQAKRQAPQEVVKVSSELLEELVNLAGETSIGRGRVEAQVSDMGHTIEEMESTIHRLQDQLRRLDIETEAQVLFRQEQLTDQEDFDPLEMDRYSQLQQLSRSLLESASDLLDLKSTLSNTTKDTETLLLQQSRVNTDLQEGLMRSRMVPFSRLVPRLRRVVRQISMEVGKQVDFELKNIDGELDRTVLERMVAPLEHMLRNAVDHGLETPEQRLAAGKPETGRIMLSLEREGGDVMLRLADDGRGVNLERVKAKAIERGLMAADVYLDDQDIIQFILHEGFSTAESITQISGRGVGLDVVSSEIKQLGGAITINSIEKQGAEFVIRLPFTVSVNRALMVRMGDDRYAIPLNNIEGLVRVSPAELKHLYQNPEARFEYAGERYQVRYLGSLLDTNTWPKIEGQVTPLPVILVRTARGKMAIQVDMLMGSREIVVKTLGPQFSSVQGVSGATVMGDGSVVVILDLYAMIRHDAALLHQQDIMQLEPQAQVDASEGVKIVLVVDDSVTVRKVTTRILEREGYLVMTAKDGFDALQVMREHIPDVILLDIEMPRMDGFEVAKYVRSESRLKHIPIIMITSRTGAKHREHAFSLGVDKYMGKPFQEKALLHNVRLVNGETSEDELH